MAVRDYVAKCTQSSKPQPTLGAHEDVFGPRDLDWQAFHRLEAAKSYFTQLRDFVARERRSKSVYPPPNV